MICVTYVFPKNGEGEFLDLAVRFIQSYAAFPAGIEHQCLVVCNGHKVTDEAESLFGEIPNCAFLEHDNSGYDVGAYQKASREVPADLMVFFGASAYLRGPGWLARMVESWKENGDTLYGTCGNRGAGPVQPHIRSTGFWISSSLFNSYPVRVTEKARGGARYDFEHGRMCLTTWIKSRRLEPLVVGWQGVYREPEWDLIPGGYHRGGQENLIAGDRMCCPPYWAVP